MNLTETQNQRRADLQRRVVTIARDTVLIPSGNEGSASLSMARYHLAKPPTEKIVFVRQWRYALRATISVAAGKLDAGEDPPPLRRNSRRITPPNCSG